MNIKNGLILLALVSLVFTSCKKDDGADGGLETFQSAEDNSMMETEFAAIFDMVEDVATGDSQVYKKSNTILPSGATVTFSDTSFLDGTGVAFCISYGALGSAIPYGMLCKDGRYRAGTLCVTIDKRFKEKGAEATVTLGGSYFAGDGEDMVQYSGTKTILRLEDNKYQISVNAATAKSKDFELSWTSNYIITKDVDIPGGILGDEYIVEGKANGINREGKEFTVTITYPLRKLVEIGCASTFIEGTLEIINTASGDRLAIDYDPFINQKCDKVVGVKVNGKEFQFIVR